MSARAVAAAACALIAVFLTGCGLSGDDSEGSGAQPLGSLALRELEGLAFLPGAEFVLAVPTGRDSVESRTFVVEAPIVFDRFEVTRRQWRRFLAQTGAAVDPWMAEHLAGWSRGTEAWPATFMSRFEAEDFAAWRGMRLPTVDEWLFAAMGPNRWPYPWGTTFRQSVANTLELGLGRPAPVGTFESGRTPTSCYDLLGNVSEWVAGTVPSAELTPGYGGAAALGGSYRSYTGSGRPIYRSPTLLSLDLHPGSRSDAVGLRCAADAEAYLWEHAPAWGTDVDTRERLGAVGERFGRQALPLLIELAARPGAPAGLHVLVEGARR